MNRVRKHFEFIRTASAVISTACAVIAVVHIVRG